MSITAYVGLPGSGKSYNVVEHVILPALEHGREIWTNIPLNLDRITEKYPEAVVVQFSIDDAKKPDFFDSVSGGAVFILDECWRIWSAGLKANNVPTEQKSFLAEHRHRVGDNGKSLEIVLVTQDLSQISAFARQLIETTYHHRKLIEVGAKNRFSVNVYTGAVTGQQPPEGLKISGSYGTYKPEIYQYYKSHTLSNAGAGDESKTDDRSNFLKSGTAKIMLVSLLVLIVIGVYSVKTAWAMFGGDKEETSEQTEQNPMPQPKVAAIERATSPIEKREFKILGHIKSERGEQTYLAVYVGDQFATVTEKELRAKGVKFEYVSECLGVITFESGQQTAISCDLPRTPRTDLARAQKPAFAL